MKKYYIEPLMPAGATFYEIIKKLSQNIKIIMKGILYRTFIASWHNSL